jgi:hypothetical protein
MVFYTHIIIAHIIIAHMADFSIADLDATQASPSPIADTLQAIANLGRDAACGFFHAYAGIVLPNPGADFPDALWDGLCRNSTPGLPPAPMPPFTGGQCLGDPYRIDYQFDVFRRSDNSLLVHANGTRSFTGGPISDITFNSGQLPNTGIGIFVTYLNAASGLPGTFNESYGGSELFYGSNFTYTLTNLAHPADACGSLPPHYPPIVVPPIPTTPGGNTYNLPSVNITFNNGNNYSLVPTLNLSGQFNPVVQIGGINISFGGGGATVTGGTQPPDNTGLLNKILTNLGDGTIGGGGVGAIAAQTQKNTAPVPKPGDPGTEVGTLIPPGTHTQKGIDKLSSVQIVLTSLPKGNSEIFASDSNYNVYIAGWFEWLQGDLVVGTRMPIQAVTTTWFPPKGSDGFTYTVVNQATATSQITKLTE